ncbi:Transcriptional regulator, Xre family [Candidatus Syntrophocurvum alkaliphilum]|uniref:Transcriptional regulator, Xre family n=1 Tax=Candidatus Syntrophocurvum alkaliphilum TaxID=2293317 RepID=A0A6I6DDZ0_9FIRM|nr:Transcriptional regulator, Xre family [Candidatus Syntrophocurvum alkaliphilum]
MQNIYCIFIIRLEGISIIKNNVRLSRVEKKLTQEELAEKVGVTRQTIGLIEKEKYNPTIALVLKLIQVLDKPLEQLFWLEED